MMYANSPFNSPSRRPVPRFRFSRHAEHLNMEDAKVALHIIIRPSLHLWKLVFGRGAITALRRPQKTVTLCDDTSSTSHSIPPKKRVRFNEQPVTISRRRFLEKWRKNSNSSPVRPCLVIRLHDDVSHKHPEPPLGTDDRSIYEDSLPDHPAFLVDLQVLEGDDSSETRPPKFVRRSEFYETESGIASFDRAGYANYCLSRWLDKKREAARAPKKPVFEDPALLLRLDRTLSPPLSDPHDAACSISSLPAPIYRPPLSLPRRIWKRLEDELQNAIVILTIGSFIHICLFLFLFYDILTRGLIPADE